jgi:hypothetical protein
MLHLANCLLFTHPPEDLIGHVGHSKASIAEVPCSHRLKHLSHTIPQSYTLLPLTCLKTTLAMWG